MTNYTTYSVIVNPFPGFNQVGLLTEEPYLDIRFASLDEAIAYAKANGFCFQEDPYCWHVIGYDADTSTWIVLEQIDMEVIDDGCEVEE